LLLGPCGKLAHVSKCALRRDDKLMTTVMIKINKLLQLFFANI